MAARFGGFVGEEVFSFVESLKRQTFIYIGSSNMLIETPIIINFLQKIIFVTFVFGMLSTGTTERSKVDTVR